jgi:signal transduction histidine kinase
MKDHRDIVRYADTVELIRHELSTPVATALLYIGIAESCVSRLPGDVVMPALRVVRSEVQRLKALIDTMTELQRAGRPTLRPRFMEIGATVRSAAKRLLTTFAGTEGVSIVVPPHGVHGWWDQTAVEQIVTNLLTNALKFGQGGSVRLVVRAAAGAGIRIAVSDNGIGIAPADRERIFERHEHAPAAQGGGMGLGLWLVRELALAHGGRVTVRSRKGHGSTFTVLLPTQPPILGAAPPAQVLPRLPPQRSPVRSVSNEPASRGPLPPYWQDRVAPRSTMVSPSLTANLKSKWPSRTRKSIPGRSLNRSRNFVAPTLRGSGA